MPDNISGFGSNQPPDPLDDKSLKGRLDTDYHQLATRFVELEQGIGRMPKTVEDDAGAQRIIDFVAQQCRPLTDEAKKTHAKEKKPYLTCAKVVDEFFLRRLDRLNLALGRVVGLAEAYHKRKKVEAARRDREEREAASRRLREAEAEAARLRAEAAAKAQQIAPHARREAITLGRQADQAAEQAADAAAILAAPPAPVRLHGDYGATGFSTERWVYEVENPALIPLGYLKEDADAINAAIDEGVREIPGLRIYQVSKFTIRRC